MTHALTTHHMRSISNISLPPAHHSHSPNSPSSKLSPSTANDKTRAESLCSLDLHSIATAIRAEAEERKERTEYKETLPTIIVRLPSTTATTKKTRQWHSLKCDAVTTITDLLKAHPIATRAALSTLTFMGYLGGLAYFSSIKEATLAQGIGFCTLLSDGPLVTMAPWLFISANDREKTALIALAFFSSTAAGTVIGSLLGKEMLALKNPGLGLLGFLCTATALSINMMIPFHRHIKRFCCPRYTSQPPTCQVVPPV